MKRLRIALLTHSVNPRGGVAHSLALAEALCAMGHEAVVHAPDPGLRGFYRAAACPTVGVAARPVDGGTADMVSARINDYVRHFATPAACAFDVFHAHDGIGGNALATLARRRLIPGFVRTVHHVDAFADPRLAYWTERSIVDAAGVLCVSRVWQGAIQREFGIDAECVGNGVDTGAFRPEPAPGDAAFRAAWGLGSGPVFLSVGGFEARKNAHGIVAAFARLRADAPDAQLVVAGGATLLDHASYQACIRADIERWGLSCGPGGAIVPTGPVSQDAMPALYRIADALLYPSLTEGFGLSVLEAMACGTPTIVSGIAPFTEYLTPADTEFVDPDAPDDIARGMRVVLRPEVGRRLRTAGFRIAGAHSWRACAQRHLPAYAALARRVPEAAYA